ncbi:myosin-binding protein 1-like isoform X1 [Zingiber officinale]|uniref:myosin-binding protein 1-like isoform X1 n=1 Tax=Zingiber officinale TaxID=94328 RepID=UPI001C4D1E64|nr:myosin-binding protein 1-like isoform X1 [Zingiber officinale]XP_042392460.1 myosin-binding protein 1-like isoform X1 [Zingiber officinale]XP_042392461.1 myosin-binding protein 1-like isoform X1 [Zingiber officinale]XP_042392462.1 myosin-binding protein 1-like isoform X1 [Zingiber officinale]
MVAGTTEAGQQAAPHLAAVAMPDRFVSALFAAVSEWCLIAILLVNAVLSYAATRLARACRLPPPCLFCSRLDHVLGGERRGFYRHILCHSHKLEVSALVYCHAHSRLANSRNTCEGCLLSSSSAAHRKPKLPVFSAAEAEHLGDVTLPDGGGDLGQASVGLCSCCAEPFAVRRDTLQSKKKKILKVDCGGVNGGLIGRRTQLRKKQGKTSELPAMHAFDPISHVGYRELKVTSESEMPFDDNDDDGYDENEDGYSPMHGVIDVEEEFSSRTKLPAEDLLTDKLSFSDVLSSPPSLFDSETKPPVAARELEGINWDNVVPNVRATESTERTIEQAPRQVSSNSDGNPEGKILESGNLSPSTGTITNDPPTTARPSGLEQSDSFRGALTRKGLMTSPRFSELVGGKASEEFKLRLSQKSFRALELPWNSDIISSPRLGELDASCSAGLLSIAKRLTMERNNSSLDNYDEACIVSDVEGETSVERLRQQVELDRKTMSSLYKELEEERNASAVAANEAMAMINRLQEEKAGMQMEALQYLRMMEEQAEYDQEANHKLNDLLTDREKELLDLEAELECCRKRLGEETITEPPEEEPSRKTELQNLVEGFEEEKAQISSCLRNLQAKLDGESRESGGSIGSPQDELTKLNDRLNALDAEQEILSRAVGALRYGAGGVRLVEEMACQLQQLRRIPAA